ncbi:hypothetical protein F5887DRAFT_597736 [Amanita rubescens]|nr:hypothetical protein F5887DRAFT_597736 [Amanita rubescens]
MPLSSVTELAPLCLVVWLVSVLYRQWTSVRDALRDIGDVPGKGIFWMHPKHLVTMVVAPWFPRPGGIGQLFGKFSVYKKYGTTCLSSVCFWTSMPVYFVSDADAFRTINNERRIFDKEPFKLIDIYGKISSRQRGASGKDIERW